MLRRLKHAYRLSQILTFNKQVIKTLKRALQPVISEVSIAWDLAKGWTVHQIPSCLPPIFTGDRLVVYGVLKASENADECGVSKVRLQGMLGNGEKIEHLITFSTLCIDDVDLIKFENKGNFLLHKLAAKSFIQERQNEQSRDSVFHFKEEAKTSIISISKSANVVSKFTSFVAVDKDSNQPVSGPLRKHVVPSFQFAAMGGSFFGSSFHEIPDSITGGSMIAQPWAAAAMTKGLGSSFGSPKYKSAPKGFAFACPQTNVAPLFGGPAPPPPPPAASAFASTTTNVSSIFGGQQQALPPSPPKSFGFAPPSTTSPLLFGGSAPPPPPPPASAFASTTANVASIFGGQQQQKQQQQQALPPSPPKAFGFALPSTTSPLLFGGSAPPPPPPPANASPMVSHSFGYPPFSAQGFQGYSAKSSCPPPAPGSMSQKRKESPSAMQVISLQRASGSWDLTDQLVSLCGTSRDTLIKGCPKEIAVDSNEGKLLWATALALVLLMGKFLDQKDEWEMIGEKGTKWMKKNLPAGVKYENVLEAAASAVGVQVNPGK